MNRDLDGINDVLFKKKVAVKVGSPTTRFRSPVAGGNPSPLSVLNTGAANYKQFKARPSVDVSARVRMRSKFEDVRK